jgi:hypothetical protein
LSNKSDRHSAKFNSKQPAESKKTVSTMCIYKSSKNCFLKEEEEEAIHLKLKVTTKIFKIVNTKKGKRKNENLWLLRRFMDI